MGHPGLEMRVKQQMALTPRLQQSVRLLQLSSIEFTQEMQQALATNPFIEEDDSVTMPLVATDVPELPPTVTAQDSLGELAGDELKRESGLDGEDEMPDSSFEPALDEESYGGSKSGRDDADDESDLGNWIPLVPTLHEHLRTQLCSYRLNDRDEALARLVIDALDDDGYLRQSFDELDAVVEADPPIDPTEWQIALKLVQHLDPVGIGARNLVECLSLQLDAIDADLELRELAKNMIVGRLDLLARRDYEALAQRHQCSVDEAREACALIRRLDPRPGARFGRADPGYVVPDVVVRKVKGKWCARINPAVLPKTRLNRLYAEMLRQSHTSGSSPLAQQLQEARWLLRNAEQRFVTIQRVADAIVAAQHTFFDYGDIAIKPLVLRDVAEELGLHESTISRATGNKYMATPRGVFEFKHFFSRQLATDTGGTCSAAAVRALLREMIASENSEAPLSDVALAKMLSQQGIVVARRTIAKYRGQMKVPPAELRRAA